MVLVVRCGPCRAVKCIRSSHRLGDTASGTGSSPSCLLALLGSQSQRLFLPMTSNNATFCELGGGRTLHSSLLRSTSRSSVCARPVHLDVASASFVAVITYSMGSQAAQRNFQELRSLALMLERHVSGAARALLVGKGTRCFDSPAAPLHNWQVRGRAHCIQGPNVGARESHTIWAYCYDFYRHLPRVTVFMQDDPSLSSLRRELMSANWAETLEASFAERRHQPSSSLPEAWVPSGCACTPVREAFSAKTYGGYRPMHWWLRSFIALYVNGSQPLPTRIGWPGAAQFALPRSAILGRSRQFHMLNMRLTEAAAPLKPNVARRAGESADYLTKRAKWANFGPMVVDLGEAPPRGSGYADGRPGINGMDAAQLFERTWFLAFDPAAQESTPAHLGCFTPEAIARSPMRCAGASCPFRSPASPPAVGGCAYTDAVGETTPPPNWPYLKSPERRCLGAGCLVGTDMDSAAWVQAGPPLRRVPARKRQT